MYHPELRGLPLAVGGDAEKRHGIVLAKKRITPSVLASKPGGLWQARQKCPGLEIIPRFPLYSVIELGQTDLRSYTPKVESFGLDECWLDLSGENMDFFEATVGRGVTCTIIGRACVTVSIGVSWNKIFAKLGSDMNKPDGYTVITPDNYGRESGRFRWGSCSTWVGYEAEVFSMRGFTRSMIGRNSPDWLQEAIGQSRLDAVAFCPGGPR